MWAPTAAFYLTSQFAPGHTAGKILHRGFRAVSTVSDTRSQTAGKVMTAAEAVAHFVPPGAVLGMGGQNIGRCPMALTHEIIRQRVGGLSVVGCNLSIAMDQLVAAGLVRRCECGSGNLERFGTIFCWRRAREHAALNRLLRTMPWSTRVLMRLLLEFARRLDRPGYLVLDDVILEKSFATRLR